MPPTGDTHWLSQNTSCKNSLRRIVDSIEVLFSGWMADFGEYSPILARTKSPENWWGQDHGEILHQVHCRIENKIKMGKREKVRLID